MGKKTRRKTRDAPKEAIEKPSTSGPVILQRIRHADASIRQAALAGILHSQLLHRKNDSSSKLLLAVREQYMGEDSNCAVAAAECLTDYLEHGQQVDEQLTAGWLALAVDRLGKESATLRLASESLQMLALLVEENPIAMRRMLNDADMQCNCLRLVLQWLETSAERQGPFTGETQRLRTDIRILAARCLESLLQDNAELMEQLLASRSLNLAIIFEGLRPYIDPTLDCSISRLHLVDAWLSAWSICKSSGDNDIRAMDLLQVLESGLDTCVHVLASSVGRAFADQEQSMSRLEQLTQVYQEWQAEVVDQKLDQDIIRKVNARKEPARNIVRRQAKQKLQQQHQDMETDDTEPDKDDTVAPAVVRVDKEQLWHDLLHTYMSEDIKPVSLALEITANLLLPLEEDGDAVMDEEASPMHPLMQKLVEQHGLVTHSYDVMGRLRQITSSDQQLPPLIRDSLDSVASKLGTCLTHALQHLPSFEATMTLWQELYQCLLAFPVSGMSHAMVLCLQTTSGVGGVGGDDDAAKVVMEWLETRRKTCLEGADDSSEMDVVTRDLICMLGGLCKSEAALSAGACVLVKMSLPDDTLVVRAERLNVLIDMFSEDDSNKIFMEAGLLSYFQKELPVLQRQVSLYRGDDADFFQETAMNASRFIQYKKGNQ